MAANEDSREAGVPQLVRPLTPKELRVLELIEQGFTNEEIGRALDIALSTVSSHVQHILKKLRVRNRVEAVLYIREQAGERRGLGQPHPLSQNTPAKRFVDFEHTTLLAVLGQVNSVNRLIALSGVLVANYPGLKGCVTLAFYEPVTQHLCVKVLLPEADHVEVTLEVDDRQWRYILELVEASPGPILNQTRQNQAEVSALPPQTNSSVREARIGESE